MAESVQYFLYRNNPALLGRSYELWIDVEKVDNFPRVDKLELSPTIVFETLEENGLPHDLRDSSLVTFRKVVYKAGG